MVHTSAIIVAAGRGRRAARNLDDPPKQLYSVGGKPLILYILDTFLKHGDIDQIILVIPPDMNSTFMRIVKDDISRIKVVHGGNTRQQSVAAGLEACANQPPVNILIHDAARPFVTPVLIDQILASLTDHEAVLPAMPVTDTLKHVHNDAVIATIDRSVLFTAQTPQGFRYDIIRDAYLRASAKGKQDFTDDASLIEWTGGSVHVINGDPENIKLTIAQDMLRTENILSSGKGHYMETRMGHGLDAHAFASNGTGSIILCGVDIPHDRSLVGHSDADVALHALTDAILGAICDGDIGKHFPPHDPLWKKADSSHFLRYATERVSKYGGKIINLDLTLICETPKIGLYRDLMCTRIATISNISVSRISVKATTMEQMGFTGRSEGIAAMATATIHLPIDQVHE